jgi:hypothetical protein
LVNWGQSTVSSNIRNNCALTPFINDAKWVVEQLLNWNPDLTIEHVKTVTPFSHDEDIKPLLRGLIKAGLPK